VRKGTRCLAPSCNDDLTIGFDFEVTAMFPVAFSFSTGTESICCGRLEPVVLHASLEFACFRGGRRVMGKKVVDAEAGCCSGIDRAGKYHPAHWPAAQTRNSIGRKEAQQFPPRHAHAAAGAAGS
jgi:hypothetical protein